jgi:hypothetical protein
MNIIFWGLKIKYNTMQKVKIIGSFCRVLMFFIICVFPLWRKLVMMFPLASMKSLTNFKNLLMTDQKSWIINSDAAVAKIFKIINCIKKQTFKLFLSFTRQPKHCKIICQFTERTGLCN